MTIFVSAAQAPDLVRDLRASRMAAAVFSRPSTHETILRHEHEARRAGS